MDLGSLIRQEPDGESDSENTTPIVVGKTVAQACVRYGVASQDNKAVVLGKARGDSGGEQYSHSQIFLSK